MRSVKYTPEVLRFYITGNGICQNYTNFMLTSASYYELHFIYGMDCLYAGIMLFVLHLYLDLQLCL